MDRRNGQKAKKALARVEKGLNEALAAIGELRDLLPGDESSVDEDEICLTPGCRNKARYRGLCGTHYNKARQEIRDGLVTEQQLVDANLMRAEKPAGRPKQPTFEDMVKAHGGDKDAAIQEIAEEGAAIVNKLVAERKKNAKKKHKVTKKKKPT